MGWKASADVKHDDLGEIPGLRELSDKEREKLEKSDPNDGLHAIKKNLRIREELVAELLLKDYDQIAIDVGNFTDNWLENPDDNSPNFDVFSPTFLQDINKQLKITGDIFNPYDVFDITCRRVLHPMMFYFGVNLDTKTNKPYVVITQRDLWDKDALQSDGEISKRVAPEFLSHATDTRFELINEMTPSKARREMYKQGFIEKHEVAGL